jgi:hypothetical protein
MCGNSRKHENMPQIVAAAMTSIRLMVPVATALVDTLHA